MDKIHILFGLEATGGGALKHLVYLVTRLNKTQFDITVVLSSLRNTDIKSEIKIMKNIGAKIIILPVTKEISPIKDLLSIYTLITILRKNKIQIVHAHSSKAGGILRIAAWLCRVPSVFYTPHCFYFQGKSGFEKKKYVILEKLLGKITTQIIVSQDEQKETIKNGIVDIAKTIVINNAIDFNEYQQCQEVEKTKAELGINNDSFIVGAIGRLAPQKDWETYIFAAAEVLKSYSKITFLIVGEGELKNEIKKQILKLNLEDKIIMTGHIKKIHKIYSIIDLLVNTSLWEGLPYVFLEAMRYKRPIITTNTGNEEGISMGENGNRRLTHKYSFELFIQKHEELYKKHININAKKKE